MLREYIYHLLSPSNRTLLEGRALAKVSIVLIEHTT